MKKITLLFALLTFSLGFAQSLPYDFETSPVTADITGFDGGGATVEAVAAPQTTGNTSTNLMKLVRNGGEAWAGVFTITPTALDFTTDKYITAQIWTDAPIGTKIMFKTEQDTNAGNNSGEKDYFTTKTGEWETIAFDFTGVANANQNKIVMIPDNGNLGDGTATSTFYFDDIAQSATDPTGTGAVKPDLPFDFETAPVTGDFVAFDGAGFAVEAVAAPQSTGNTSTNLGKLVRNGGEVWAGVGVELETNFDFTAKQYITAKIWTDAPIGTKVMFKTEENTNAGNNSGEKDVFTTKTGEWETLVFDFSTSLSNVNQNKLVMIPANGVLGDGSATSTFYFDDIENTNTLLSTDEFTAAQFNVFPNPTANDWNVKSNTTIRTIAVYDILGKQVQLTTPNATNVKINAAGLTAGMYFAKIEGENGTKTVKLIKQ